MALRRPSYNQRMRRLRLAVYFALPVIIVGLLVLSQFALSSGQGAWHSIQSLWGHHQRRVDGPRLN